MNNKHRPWQIFTTALGALVVATSAAAAPLSQSETAAPATSAALPGIGNFEKSFRENNVTIIADTDHRNPALQQYYSDPRFLDAAARSGIKAIILEISAEMQPEINALANAKISKDEFVASAPGIEHIDFVDSKKYFSSIADAVLNAKQKGIQIIAGDAILYPRTPEISKLIESYRNYVKRASPQDWQEIKDDKPPYPSFNPSYMFKFSEFVNAHGTEFDIMQKQWLDYRKTVAGNLPGIIISAKAILQKDNITVDEFKKAYKHTIIIFGSGHAYAFQSLLKQEELSSSVINFEPTVSEYMLHENSLTKGISGVENPYIKVDGMGYPERAAFIRETNQFIPGHNPAVAAPKVTVRPALSASR